MKPIEPQQIDGMPREVATAMLTEPKAQLSNRMRKVCMRAREKVFVSSSPIRRMPATDAAGNIIKGWGYTEQAPLEVEIKTAERFAYATLQQLGKWCSRAIKRRVVVQRAYLAVPNSDVPYQQARFDHARELYAALADKLDVIQDCAEVEINERARFAYGIVGVRREPGSSVDFRTRLPV